MSATNSFCVYAEWHYSAAFGYLLLFACQEVVMSWIKTLSVIMLNIFPYASKSGYYLVVILCCLLMGCVVDHLASLSAGPISHGPLGVKWMTSYVGLCDEKNPIVYQ
jgi:hypothetical protein